MHIEKLESRRLLSSDVPMPSVRLLADTNRDGVIDAPDEADKKHWTDDAGAIVLPNCDEDNTLTGAPDNWTGGVWNGSPVAPNNVIDNAADLRDIGKLRMSKLGNVDNAYDYRITLRILTPTDDPAWFRNTSAADRVRLFYPTLQRDNGDVVCRPGDPAVLGPGIGDTIRFVTNPAGANEHSILDLVGEGDFVFGVEGIKAGAVVRVQMKIEYDPIIISSEPIDGPIGGPIDDDGDEPAAEELPFEKDEIAIRVAPFVVATNQGRVDKAIVENMNRYGLDNSDVRAAMKKMFGDRLIEGRTGDLWQQDGYEVGYAQAPYGQMPVILELPRARDYFFDADFNMRSHIRGKLLRAGVGVSTELAAFANDSASAFGGDIETIPMPGRAAGKPGFLLASDMPNYMRKFFKAQDVNPLLDLNLDEWLGVAHVDEVVHLARGGDKVLIADPDIAWALALWAVELDPDVRMLPDMNSNSSLPDHTAEGIKAKLFLANDGFRRQNLDYVQSQERLTGVFNTVKEAMGLTREVSKPAAADGNQGSAKLARGGAFTQFLGDVKRTFEIRFLDADRYQIRYQDAGGSNSQWYAGRKSRDEVFPDARAFILKNYWSGDAQAGDRFTFKTNPNATLVKTPALFASFGLFHDGPGEGPWRLAPFTTNPLNSLSDGESVLVGKAHGPKVDWDGRGERDLFQDYTRSVFRQAGYEQILFADARLYHDSGGGIHCGTNVIRDVPEENWWEV